MKYCNRLNTQIPIWLKSIRLVAVVVFFICVAMNSLMAQELTGQVIDQKTNEGLPYVQILIPKTGKGTLTDEEGKFTLQRNGLNPSDTIIFSYIGYDKVYKTVNQLENNDGNQVWLKEKSYDLPSVVIKSKKPKVKKYGYPRTDGNSKCSWYNGGNYENDVNSLKNFIEVGTRIKIRRKPAIVRSVGFHILRNCFDSITMRIHIYSMDDNEMPKQELLPKNIFVTTAVKKGWVVVPMQELELTLQEDVIVSIESVSGRGKCKPQFQINDKTVEESQFAISCGLTGNLVIRDFENYQEWESYRIGHPGIYVEVLTD